MTAEGKAHRILAEGRLTVERVDGAVVVASCRGFSNGEVYRLGFDPREGGQWRCTCEANATFHRRCSHLIALQLVTTKPKEEDARRLSGFDCANCGEPADAHCDVHLVPCCPGKCPGPQPPTEGS